MDTSQIQSFIDDTLYDFQTIEHSLAYHRIKETVPVLLQIVTRIQSFRSQFGLKDNQFKNIFLDSPWDNDIYSKIKERSLRGGVIPQKELQDINYEGYLGEIRSWTYENIFELRKIIKTPRQRNMELVLMAISSAAILLCLVAVFLLNVFLHDWGLKGDFYQGQNFENHVSTGTAKVIDFGSYLQMNPRMPYEHSSAHWQGSLIVPRDGLYVISVIADDGVRLFLDNQLLINEWQDNDSFEFDRMIFLYKGEHPIQLDYYNNYEGSVLKLYWAFEGQEKEIIPARYLRHKD